MAATLAFIMYPVSDIAASAKFYEDALGFERSGVAADFWIEYALGDATFGIGTFPQVGTPGTAQALAIEVDDLAATRAALAAKGVASTEPFETPVCFISVMQDPDGNKIVLHHAKK
jgi:predicted enzyme related to lactoylglutathione lyase